MLRGSRGFSLMEVMVAAGALAVLAVATAALLRTGGAGQKTLLSQEDARSLTSAIARGLTDPAACAKTFGGLNPAAGASLTQIRDQAGSPRYVVGSTYGNRTLSLTGIQMGGSGTDPKTNTQKWVPASTGDKGTAFVEISWAQVATNGNQGGPSQLQRNLLIDATIDPATKLITSCTAETGLAAGNNFGNGTPNFVPLWIDSATLGDSVLAQRGANIGLGVGIPASTFDVKGGVSLGSYSGSAPAPADSVIMSGPLGVRTSAPGAAVEVAGSMRLSNSAGYVGLRAPAAVATPVTWTLPPTDGSAGQFLSTNGAGQLFWADCSLAYAACLAQIISDCDLPDTPHGGSAGACLAEDTGSCSYQCRNGSWSEVSNSCVKACTEPGSRTFSAPGTYSFVVPKYCTKLTVVVRGGGGGGGQGGGASYWEDCQYSAGAQSARPGGLSSFNGAMVARGGGAGSCSGAGGAGGGSSGGTTNLTGGNGQPGSLRPDGHQAAPGRGGAGGGPGGGAGGDPGLCAQNNATAPGGLGGTPGGGGGGSGCWNGGGGGGGGGYTAQTFGKGALAPGSTITVVVGAGGAGENRKIPGESGGPGGGGAAGSVTIDWN